MGGEIMWPSCLCLAGGPAQRSCVPPAAAACACAAAAGAAEAAALPLFLAQQLAAQRRRLLERGGQRRIQLPRPRRAPQRARRGSSGRGRGGGADRNYIGRAL